MCRRRNRITCGAIVVPYELAASATNEMDMECHRELVSINIARVGVFRLRALGILLIHFPKRSVDALQFRLYFFRIVMNLTTELNQVFAAAFQQFLSEVLKRFSIVVRTGNAGFLCWFNFLNAIPNLF